MTERSQLRFIQLGGQSFYTGNEGSPTVELPEAFLLMVLLYFNAGELYLEAELLFQGAICIAKGPIGKKRTHSDPNSARTRKERRFCHAPTDRATAIIPRERIEGRV